MPDFHYPTYEELQAGRDNPKSPYYIRVQTHADIMRDEKKFAWKLTIPVGINGYWVRINFRLWKPTRHFWYSVEYCFNCRWGYIIHPKEIFAT